MNVRPDLTEFTRLSVFICRAAICTIVTILAAGCRPVPGSEDLPPLPKFSPGVFSDLNPRWSHDGKRIAFLRSTPDRRLQLFVADRELERPFALLESEMVCPDRPYSSRRQCFASGDTVAWSPDDRQIAFERTEWFNFDDGQRLPGTGLWAFDTLTGRVTPLVLHPKKYTSLFYYFHSPAWSPDGRFLAFVGEGINGQRWIGIRTLNAQSPKEVAPRFDNYSSSDWPCWRPLRQNNRRLADSGTQETILTYSQGISRSPSIPFTATLRNVHPGSSVSAGSGEIWRMTPGEYAKQNSVVARQPQGCVLEPRIGNLVWSPDGRRLAYTLTPDALENTRCETWVFSLDNGQASRVSPADGRGYIAPVWIDNRRMGLLSPNGERFDVVTVVLGRDKQRVIGSIDTADCDWSPDRSLIVYAVPKQDSPNSPDTPTTLRILETKLRVHAAWRPEDIEE